MPTQNIFKRCSCIDPGTGRPYTGRCPDLTRTNGSWSAHHGEWCYQIELPHPPGGRRRQLKRGKFDSSTAAQAELDRVRSLLALAGHDLDTRCQVADLLLTAVREHRKLPDRDEVAGRIKRGIDIAGTLTVGAYLTEWIRQMTATAGLAGGTVTHYQSHIQVHLIPHLGDIPIDDLRPRHVRAMFEAIIAQNTAMETARHSDDPAVRATVRGKRPTGPATRQRIRATLRNALNHALIDELVTMNAAEHVKTPEPKPEPMVWTDERVRRWRDTGEIPGPVMVWTVDQTCTFLDYTKVHAPDIHPMLHLAAYRGPRRGELCGLKESEVRPGHKTARVTNQITKGLHGNEQKPPKSSKGVRDVFYDDDTHQVLTAYTATKAARKLAAGPAWPDTGLFFVRPDGRPWNPATISQRFRRLVTRCGLPPIRFHDLRHIAATIGLQAGVDIRVMQEQLGHSTPDLTRAYTTVLEELHRDAADAVARVMKRRTA